MHGSLKKEFDLGADLSDAVPIYIPRSQPILVRFSNQRDFPMADKLLRYWDSRKNDPSIDDKALFDRWYAVDELDWGRASRKHHPIESAFGDEGPDPV